MPKYVQDKKTGKMKGAIPDSRSNVPTAQPPRPATSAVPSASSNDPALVTYQQRADILKAFKRWQKEGRDVILDRPTGFYVDRNTGEILDLDD